MHLACRIKRNSAPVNLSMLTVSIFHSASIAIVFDVKGRIVEAVLFTGLQASGKSSFYKQEFFNTHVRISLDLIRTRYREQRLLKLCLETEQRFVVDNTNPTLQERSVYIKLSRQFGFRIKGYYFQSNVKDCLRRNESRKVTVPDVAILSTSKKLEVPSIAEGFHELSYVWLKDGKFVVEDWDNAI